MNQPEDLSLFYQAAIGRKSAYYLPKFKEYDQNGIHASWNWAVFLANFLSWGVGGLCLWMLYRKMWLYSVVYLMALFLLSAFITQFYLNAHDLAETLILIFFHIALHGIILFVIMPMYANVFYYYHIKAKIAAIRAMPLNQEQQIRQLTQIGGSLLFNTKPPSALFYLVILFILALIFVLYVLLGNLYLGKFV